MSECTIEKAAEIIRNGGLVAFPTETVYGLGADAFNPEAVARIFIEKERPSFDPLIVHICNLGDLYLLGRHVDDRLLLLAKTFWPGPLTIVVPKSIAVPDIVTSGLPTVAIRMPDNHVALKLIEASGRPIAAPSANKFGRLSPTTAQHVRKQLPNIGCILNDGNTTVGIESTVIALNVQGFEILRNGVITREDIEKVVPYAKGSNSDNTLLASPGLLKSHYSPVKPFYILGEYTPGDIDKNKAGFISFTENNHHGYKVVAYLSRKSDLKEAAVNLFEAMHRLEDADVDFIIAEPVPEQGIGIAIMDRLRKAAYKYIED